MQLINNKNGYTNITPSTYNLLICMF
jgi:hypothetical protein